MELISRQSAIDALDKRFDSIPMEQTSEILLLRKDLRELPPATDNNVGTKLSTNLASLGTDCISRQAAIDAMAELQESTSSKGVLKGISKAWKRIEQLPPIQPKKGKWIKLDMHRGMADHKCTACEQECYVPTCMGEPMYAFCPNCGADMRGEQND